jgi:hypothetical protein
LGRQSFGIHALFDAAELDERGAPHYRAIGSESLRPSGPDVERRRQRGIAHKAVDIRAITTSELEFSAPIDTEYAELAVRTLHALDARAGALLRRGGPNPWYTSLERRINGVS